MLKRLLLPAALLAISPSTASAVSLLFDYTYDTNGFFTPARRSTLQAAGLWIGSRLGDDLSAIVPSGGNTWTQEFDHPSTGNRLSLANRSVAANALVIYVGASELGSSTAGEGGPGGYSASGSTSWLDQVDSRGQAGGLINPPTDFGPWGGAITFDLTTTWYADQNTATTEPFAGIDLYSVALHEIAHVLGFGTSIPFNQQIDFTAITFTGSSSTAVFGSNPPLNNEAHWRAGLTSTVFGTSIQQQVAMDPTILEGTRKHLTELDMAGLRDIGWEVVPEPSVGLMLLLGTGVMLGRRRRNLVS